MNKLIADKGFCIKAKLLMSYGVSRKVWRHYSAEQKAQLVHTIKTDYPKANTEKIKELINAAYEN